MGEIEEILYQHWQGKSIRQIANSLQVSRNTIKKLIKQVRELETKWPAIPLSELSKIVQKHQQAQADKSPCFGQPARSLLTCYHNELVHYLEMPYMTMRQCWRLLQEKHGITVSETTVHRYIKAHIRAVPSPAVIPLPTSPGKQAQVDFGYVGLLVCVTTGKARKAYAFIMTLSHSRYRFVYFVFKQDTATWVDCHRRAFEFFGGVPESIILDNLKAGVIKPDLYDPTLNRAYAECEKYYGFIADPAKVRVAKHKGKVERSVTLVKQQVIAGRDFQDIQTANAFAAHWCREEIATKITRTTGETPKLRFERDEKPKLLALPVTPFETPVWQSAQVQKDSHVTFQGSFYSVPPGYLQQTVWLRADTRLVSIYTASHTLVKRHPRATAKGQWQTDWQDIPKNQRDYVLQTSEQLLSLASHIGAHTLKWVTQIIGTTLTETRKRKIHALLRLATDYGPARLDAACLRALTFNNNQLKAIIRILEQGLDAQSLQTPTSPTPPQDGAFLHNPQDFYLQ